MNDHIDPRNKLDDEPFDYQETKSGLVLIYWDGRLVKKLSNHAGKRFLQQIVGADAKTAQLVMAKVTGNFKRGNERPTNRP